MSFPPEQPPSVNNRDLDPLMMENPPSARQSSGGLMGSNPGWSLTSDHRAFRPGDILTIMLDETTQASKRADTRMGKDSGVSGKIRAGTSLNKSGNLSVDRDFKGSSSSSQQNTLSGAITVIVTRVMPNGILEIAGEKNLYINQGEEFIRLTGYVRSADIKGDNRISSQRVANARIVYAGKGALADANTAGWLTRFFNSPWVPF